MSKYKVALARFPGDGWECHQCVDFLVRTTRQMREDDRIEQIIPLRYSTTPITMARNKCVLDARAAGADYLLMIDSDMAPDAYWPRASMFWEVAWKFMMERENDQLLWRQMSQDHKDGPEAEALRAYPPATISAPYCGPPPAELVYVFHWTNQESDNPNPDWKLQMIPREMTAIMAGTQEVAAMATGLILYDMRVFDVLPPPWFCYEYKDKTESEKVTTEDVYQTRNASLLGLPQFVAWDCWAGHLKDKLVGKPVIVRRDQVHESLRQAVLRGVDSDHTLRVLTEAVRVQEAQPSADGHSLADILADEVEVSPDGFDPNEPGPEPPPDLKQRPAPRSAEEAKEQYFSDEDAFTLIEKGIWMTGGGYTFRNRRGDHPGDYWGEYLAGGSIPGPDTIRTSDPTTLANLKAIRGASPRLIWRRVEKTFYVPTAEDMKASNAILKKAFPSPQTMEAEMAMEWKPSDYWPDPHKKPEPQ